MRVFLVNANSVKNKIWQFESEILMYHNFPEFIAITETWLTEDISSDLFKFNAYSVFRRDRISDPHGGVMFLVKNNLGSEQISRDSRIEILWVMVDIGIHRTIFGVYYRAHVSHVCELDLLREELAFVVDLHPNVPIVLVGDFNMPDINWAEGLSPSVYKQDEYLDLFSEYNLTQVVDKPTRRDKILDLVLVSEPSSVLKVETHAPLGKSDHEVVECWLAGPSTVMDKKHDMGSHRYCWSRARWKELKQALQSINWWNIFLEDDLHDVNKMWSKFKEEMHRQIALHVPKLSKNVQNRIGRLSKTALSAIREKRRAHRQLQRTRLEADNNDNNNNDEKRAYQAAVRNVGDVLTREKIRKERNLVNNPSLGKFYKFINSKLKHKQSVSSIRLPDGAVTTDERKISEVFSEYFKSVFFARTSPLPRVP
jgi:hypothetical protein